MNKNYLKEWLEKEKSLVNKNNFSSHIKKYHQIEYQEIKNTTKYLDNNCKFSERIYHIINNIHKNTFYCPECKNSLKFKHLDSGYRTYCSLKCMNKSSLLVDKIKKTKLQKYGDENYNNTKKMKETWKNKSPESISSFIEKNKNTKKIKHGNSNFNNRNKFLETWNKKSENEKETIIEKQFNSKLKNGFKTKYDGISGKHKNIFYQSTWELSFIIFCLEHKIQIERNEKGFIYWFKDKKHRYYPDFYLPEVDQYVEIKGIRVDKDKDKAKWEQFSYKLDIYNKEKMKPILKFILNKFGWNFFKKKYLDNILKEYEDGKTSFN